MGQSTSKNPPVFEPRVKSHDLTFSYDEPLLASVLEEIDTQTQSLLYTRLPGEVREMIFRLSITDSLKSEPPKRPLSHKNGSTVSRRNTSYLQFQQSLQSNSSLALLLTCRRTYLETYHLPMQVKEHTFYRPSLIGPPGLPNLSIEKYFQRFKPQQLRFLTSTHIVTHQLFLEDGSFTAICKLGLLQWIQKLKITIRYRDWWEWERNSKMELSPWGRYLESYTLDGTKKVHFESLKEHAWGYAFQYLTGLKELQLQLETSEDRIDELECVVYEARAWQFPMSSDRVLRTQTSPVQRSWSECSSCTWSNVCGRCFGQGDNCKDCFRRQTRRDSGLGPILYTAVLIWHVGLAIY